MTVVARQLAPNFTRIAATACGRSAHRNPSHGPTATTSLSFATSLFVARNGVLAVFGNVKADEVRALVEQALSALPPLANLPWSPSHSPLPLLPRARSIAPKEQRAAGGSHDRLPLVDLCSPDRAALELIDEASSDLGSRFLCRIREEMGLALRGRYKMIGLAHGPFVFYCRRRSGQGG